MSWYLHPFAGRRKEIEKLMVSETASSTFHYHLRKVKEGEEKYGGGAGPALCGQPLGWDTKIPLSAYGQKDHLPSSWCKECEALAETAGFSLKK